MSAGELCTNCGLVVPSDQVVRLNGDVLHPEACFASALRRLAHTAVEPLVKLNRTMQPMVAYKAGKTFIATIVAERRKAKPPAQQSFSAGNFNRKQR